MPTPHHLIRFMRNYESEMEHASAASGEKASGKELLGEMHEIYYGNRFTIDRIFYSHMTKRL